MSYIDPDQFHGVIDEIITHVDNNAAALTAGGLDPAVTKNKLATIRDDVAGKKNVRDAKKTDLAVAQQAYAASASNNYTAFSNLVDVIAGALGKTTPAGVQALGYRKTLNAVTTHRTPAPAAATPAKTA
jgi:hypothetical protein